MYRTVSFLKMAVVMCIAFASAFPSAAYALPINIRDLGDAPDSTNNGGAMMQAYPGLAVVADFPTVFGGPAPMGAMHFNQELRYHLGKEISQEFEADIAFDADGVNNIIPAANAANRDGKDDGLRLPDRLPHCERIRLTFYVNSLLPDPQDALVNLYMDFERDGRWVQAAPPVCPNGVAAPDWAVQNFSITIPGAGIHTYQTPPIFVWNPTPEQPMWLRISLSDISGDNIGGSPGGIPYNLGETEDYLLPGEKSSTAAESALELVSRGIQGTGKTLTPVLLGKRVQVSESTNEFQWLSISGENDALAIKLPTGHRSSDVTLKRGVIGGG